MLLLLSSVTIIAIGINGYIGYSTAKTSLETESFNKLTAVREMKANQVEDYFQQISDQLHTFSENRMVIEAMIAFKDSFHKIDSELDINDAEMQTSLRYYYRNEFAEKLTLNLNQEARWPDEKNEQIMQYLYISTNPHEIGSKGLLDYADDGSSYSQAHKIYHPIIRSYLEKFGYYDIFLVDSETGHIVYTVFKEVDYGTSLLTGQYNKTSFAVAFRAAQEATDKDFIKLVDFESYLPSYNAPASFMASPIYDGDEKIGVLLFQMPIDRLNDIMTSKQEWSEVGLGISGETYIVGNDYKLRNQSRFLIEDSVNYFKIIEQIGTPQETINKIRILNSTIGLQTVKTLGTTAALQGETSIQIFQDYRGVPVLSAYKPLNIPDMNWVIMSEIDESEAFSHVYNLRNRVILSCIGLVSAVVMITFFFSQTITRPLKELTKDAEALAKGNLDIEIDTEGKDEVGDLAGSFKDMAKQLQMTFANLEASIKQHRSLFEGSREAIIITKPNGQIVDINPACSELFGYTREEILKLSAKDCYVNSEDRLKFWLVLEQQGSVENYEVQLCKKNGAVMDSLITATAQHGEGSMMVFQKIIRDVTKRKKEELKMRQLSAIEHELKIAQDVHQNLLLSPTPNWDDLDVVCYNQPTYEVGGEFYYYTFKSLQHQNIYAVAVGDAEGERLPAALLMAITLAALESSLKQVYSSSGSITQPIDVSCSLGKLFENLDQAILRFTEKFDRNCTLTYVEITKSDGQPPILRAVNAGGVKPLILRADGTTEWIEVFGERLGTGLSKEAGYQEIQLDLMKGDTIILITDGILETTNKNNQQFGMDRFEQIVKVAPQSTATEMITYLQSKVTKFIGDVELQDDLTILVVKNECDNSP